MPAIEQRTALFRKQRETSARMKEEAPTRRRWFQFKLRTLLIAVLVLSLPLAWLSIAFRPVMVRTPLETDIVHERYFMIPSPDDSLEDITIRDIAIVEGTFSKSTWLSAGLAVVKSGKVERKSGFTAGRSPNRLGEPVWKKMEITLAIGESQASNGRQTYFGCCGATRAAGNSGPFIIESEAVEKRLLAGRLVTGHECILYVEGSEGFSVSRNMTLEEFAQSNSGEFLVVVARLE